MRYSQLIYQIEVKHDKLNKYKIVRGRTKFEAEEKAKTQLATWNEMWERKLIAEEKKSIAEEKRREKEINKQNQERNKNSAKEKTKKAQNELIVIENLLRDNLQGRDSSFWEFLEDKTQFNEPFPKEQGLILYPPFTLTKPDESKYKPEMGITDKIFIKSREKKESDYKKLYLSDLNIYNLEYQKWWNQKLAIDKQNEMNKKPYELEVDQWNKKKEMFYIEQNKKNLKVGKYKNEYLKKTKSGIIDYNKLVLLNSKYPKNFRKKFDLDFNEINGILIVEYQLPLIENLPKVKEVKYIQSNDEFKETYYSDSFLNKLYDNSLYQIALRTINELFLSDQIKVINSVVFNGWTESLDKGTGKIVNACILSVQTQRDEFLSLNLKNVDPKECFKKLKGVGSSQLHSLTPVAPLMNIDRKDSRFVSSYDVTDKIDQSTNLAAMDWEDFEHLIRELFEKEFTQTGGEVKVTQASKDGGVDAIAFDPDPIRGGKIVIQAKRYTNVVGVSAVRDLFGTVMNEGATKGILVTTSDYGPDAYNFVKDKPITLLNGGNLLHLLEKHGHKAKIDIKEAKKILSEQQ